MDIQTKSIDDMVVTDAEPHLYADEMGIDAEKLSGMSVLEVGSGISEKFARVAVKHGATVVALNPYYAAKLYRKNLERDEADLEKEYGPAPMRVAGFIEMAPLKDASFDLIVGRWSFPKHLESKNIRPATQNVLRLLKPGGKAVFSPVLNDALYWLIEEEVSKHPGYSYRLTGERLEIYRNNE